MEFSSAKLIYFSPTQTTKKIVHSIAQGFSFDRIEDIDITSPETDTRIFSGIGNELTILGTPVYAGRVPIVAVRRMQRIKAQGTPVLVVVVYKFKGLSVIDDRAPLEVPGNFPYKERMPGTSESPLTQEILCTLCGTCASVCPTEAVIVNDTVVTEAERCILCQACVKNCPTGARITAVPRIKQVAQWLNSNYSKRKEPVIFL